MIVALVLAWGGVACWWFAGTRSDHRPVDSIGDFRRQLHVMSRSTGGALMSPANTLRDAHRSPNGPMAALRGPALTRPHGLPGYGGGPVHPMVARRLSPKAAARRQAQRRRRDILFTLAGAAALTLVLSFLPGLGMLLFVHLVCDVLIGGYVALLVRLRSIEAERDMKVRFLPARAQHDGGFAYQRVSY